MKSHAAAFLHPPPWMLIVFLAALSIPWLGSRYETFLATQIAIYALFAVSLNLLLGTTGLVSFGHVAYFGIGAYVCGILMKTYAMPFLLALSAAAFGAAGFALVFGYFCVRLTRIYFAMLTLAFSQIVWAICFKWNDVTGGDQGLPDVPYPDLHWMSAIPGLVDLRIADRFYVLTLVVVILSLAAMQRIIGSPFGRILTMIRENPEARRLRRRRRPLVPARRLRRRRRLRRDCRCVVRHLQPRRLRRLHVLAEIGRGIDYDHPRRHPIFLGAGCRRRGARPAQPGNHFLHRVLAASSRRDPDHPAVRLPGRHRWRDCDRPRPARSSHLGARGCLRCVGLSKSFAGFSAVTQVNLTVTEGQIAAVIGPNGAGKTTLFNLITGHLRPTAGRVVVYGRDVTGVSPHRICRFGIGRSFQHTNIFPKLTVFENVQAALLVHRGIGRNFWSRSASLAREESARLLASIGLARHAQAVAGTLAYGNQKQLELGIALGAIPKSCCSTSRPPACRRSRHTRRSCSWSASPANAS